MKKGDILGNKKVFAVGDVLYRGFKEETIAHAFMQHSFKDFYASEIVPPYTIVEDQIQTLVAFEVIEKFKVNWVIGEEAAVQSLSDSKSNFIIAVDDPEYFILQESAPSFQSQVANMTDEQLRASIDELRQKRIVIEPKKEKKLKVEKTSQEENALIGLMGQLNEEEQKKLLAKLGML